MSLEFSFSRPYDIDKIPISKTSNIYLIKESNILSTGELEKSRKFVGALNMIVGIKVVVKTNRHPFLYVKSKADPILTLSPTAADGKITSILAIKYCIGSEKINVTHQIIPK